MTTQERELIELLKKKKIRSFNAQELVPELEWSRQSVDKVLFSLVSSGKVKRHRRKGSNKGNHVKTYYYGR